MHYASPGAMDIEGLGKKIAIQLIDRGLVKNLSDLYELNEKDFLKLDLFAEKKAKNLYESIQRSKDCELANFIYALGFFSKILFETLFFLRRKQVGYKVLVLQILFTGFEAIGDTASKDFNWIAIGT